MTAPTPPGRRRLVGLSSKMYFSLDQTRDYTADLLTRLAALPPSDLSSIDIFILPDFLTVPSTAAQVRASSSPVWVGAQDCHWEDRGAFTGEVSPAALAAAGARIVAVGHAERRRLFAEDDALVLAYEPVWAIGAAQPAGDAHVLAVVAGLRALDCVQGRSGTTRIVYGGSAGPGLFERLKTGLDGLFLGRFAHDPERFVQTVKEVAEAEV
ncbi:triosephosphate isomerase 2 [Cordyceps fumosorosea ARSEF 2679]|uniref:Triosephosphate isomerase n=1 Tax=Cordyceps fumosorosea (strain ARSEF 2679) TaxID=1081104 RepID=A0A168B7N9_CORFA|nr:triosephosphate isomerase 2 [Cordyceps fumosorosea ARSEF 2679]OAA69737.1 triosephosphate isomerase 2 [Cordyceps fumosorosea ARSEF 2679]